MATIQLPPGFSAVQSSGPMIIGYMLNWGLYGVLCVQCYFYYVAFPKDRLIIKLLVSVLMSFGTIQAIIIFYQAFLLYASKFGDVELFSTPPLLWLAITTFNGIVGCIVQLFFAYRIGILSRSKIPGLIITTLALSGCVAAITTGAQMRKSVLNRSGLESSIYIAYAIWVSCTSTCDILITLCMTYYLSIGKTGMPATQALENRLMRLMLETGAITALITSIDLCIFFVFPDRNYHTTFCMIISNLYSITTLAILNSRMHIDGGRNSAAFDDVATLGPMHFNSSASNDEITQNFSRGNPNFSRITKSNGFSFNSVGVPEMLDAITISSFKKAKGIEKAPSETDSSP